ncbi:MAG: hypothetical protein KJ626_02785 [Verrucomicrobia bacterium]|nr:hypothetical protein [Verrucomicrobiota bacterium]
MAPTPGVPTVGGTSPFKRVSREVVCSLFAWGGLPGPETSGQDASCKTPLRLASKRGARKTRFRTL